jgi:hypothetical protein
MEIYDCSFRFLLSPTFIVKTIHNIMKIFHCRRDVPFYSLKKMFSHYFSHELRSNQIKDEQKNVLTDVNKKWFILELTATYCWVQPKEA